MEIKVLGSGCANCKALESNAIEALEHLGLTPTVEKVTDYGAIAAYGVMSTPALVIDDVVVVAGRVPSVAELQAHLSRVSA